jgi:hypothetical protein
MAIQVPAPHAAEVAAMSFLGLQIQVCKDIFNVVPILHENCIGMIQNSDFDGRKKVIV